MNPKGCRFKSCRTHHSFFAQFVAALTVRGLIIFLFHHIVLLGAFWCDAITSKDLLMDWIKGI